jgi:hypothetical protein
VTDVVLIALALLAAYLIGMVDQALDWPSWASAVVGLLLGFVAVGLGGVS